MAFIERGIVELVPLQDRLVIRPEERKEKMTEAGVIIPGTEWGWSDGNDQGTVLAVGPDVSENIQVGDTVVFMSFTGCELRFEGGKYCTVKEKDVVAIVR